MKQFILILVVFGLVGYVAWAFYNTDKKIDDFAKSSTTTEATVTEPQQTNSEKDTTTLGSIVILGNLILDGAEYSVPSAGFNNQLTEYLKSANCRLAPLQSPLKGQHINTSRSNYQEASEKAYNLLNQLDISMVGIGQGHFIDQGNDGVNNSKSWLDNQSIAYSGASNQDSDPYHAATINCGQLRVGIISSTEDDNSSGNGVKLALNEKLTASVKSLKAQTDFVIVMTDWAEDASKFVSPYQKGIAHSLIDSGADLVVGNHPQFIQTMENYNNRLIFYSLGNFLVPSKYNENKSEGMTVKLTISEASVSADIVPLSNTKSDPTIVTDNLPETYLQTLGLESWSANFKR